MSSLSLPETESTTNTLNSEVKRSSDSASIVSNNLSSYRADSDHCDDLLAAQTDLAKDQKASKSPKKPSTEEEVVNKLVQNAFNEIIGKDEYSPLKTTAWIKKMIEKVSSGLLKRDNWHRKFVVQCTIASKTKDFSICSAEMCSWDVSSDVSYYFEWTSKSVFGSVHIFLISHRFSK